MLLLPQAQVRGLSHACRDLVSLELACGQAMRVKLALSPGSALSAACLEAVRSVLDADAFHMLLQLYYSHPGGCTAHISRDSRKAGWLGGREGGGQGM